MDETFDDLRSRVRQVFQAAAERRDVTFSERTLQDLTSKAISNAEIERGGFQRILSQGDFKPSNRLAVFLAEQIRRVLKVSDVEPLFDLPSLLIESLGIETIEIEESSICGGCAVIAGQPLIFVSKSDGTQQLFTCAHELAHVILLSSQGESAVVDRIGDSLGTAKNPHEHFADNVALRLLIPQKGLGIALKETRRILRASGALGDVELLYVSRIFGVSFLAMCKRCEQANLLPRGGATALDRFLSEKFGGAEQRAAQLDLPPRPRFSLTARGSVDGKEVRSSAPRPLVRSQKQL